MSTKKAQLVAVGGEIQIRTWNPRAEEWDYNKYDPSFDSNEARKAFAYSPYFEPVNFDFVGYA